MKIAQYIYRMLVSRTGDEAGNGLDRSVEQAQARNFLTHVTSLSATKSADGLIDPKLVLSWLLTSLGAPSFLTGMLVPVREAGALLPQLFTAAWIARMNQRKWAWAAGSFVQGIAAASIGACALFLDGSVAGYAILALLAVLALSRSICSVSYKDVLGRTLLKKTRGTATGTASSISAGIVIAFGLLLTSGLAERKSLVIGGLFVAAALWLTGAALFTRLSEEKGATEHSGDTLSAAIGNISLLWKDRQFGRFVLTRSLLISTALAPPYMVMLSTAAGGGDGRSGYGELGLLVIASATATLLSGYVWGRLSDRSSRKVLFYSALAASVTLVLTIAAAWFGLIRLPLVLPALVFGLMIAYQGVRIGRSTHLVDMAGDSDRAAYTAVSNTVIGVLLLLVGAFGAIASIAGAEAVLGLFAVMALCAMFAAHGLEEVQQD
ncbi:MAG: MFS transporter [Nitratireductor sp.]|nr:MFS transporter [Nitratireductor sp.]